MKVLSNESCVGAKEHLEKSAELIDRIERILGIRELLDYLGIIAVFNDLGNYHPYADSVFCFSIIPRPCSSGFTFRSQTNTHI